MTKKLADQVFKRWIITDGIEILSEPATLYESLGEVKGRFEEEFHEGYVDEMWYIQEVTLGVKHEMEQEPKWVEKK